MCLIVDSKNPLIAKKDIVCYKVCIATQNESLVITPYQLATLTIGATYVEGSNECFTQSIKNNYFLTGGAYHSFKYLADARINKKTWGSASQCSWCIIKCVIPKGSKYYVGSFGNLEYVFRSYASKQIKLIEKIK